MTPAACPFARTELSEARKDKSRKKMSVSFWRFSALHLSTEVCTMHLRGEGGPTQCLK